MKKTKIIIEAMVPAALATHFNGAFHRAAARHLQLGQRASPERKGRPHLRNGRSSSIRSPLRHQLRPVCPSLLTRPVLSERTVVKNGGQRGVEIELDPDDASNALDAIVQPLTV